MIITITAMANLNDENARLRKELAELHSAREQEKVEHNYI